MSKPRSSSAAGGSPSVLHVVPYYPPDKIGGVGEVARLIHKGLLQRGIHSEVLTSGTDTNSDLVHRVSRSATGFIFKAWSQLRLASRFDVIECHHGEALLLLVRIRLQRRRPRILMMFHVDVRRRERASGPHMFRGSTYGPHGLRNLLRRTYGFFKAMVDRFAWMLADAVIVETQSVKRELSDLWPNKRVTIIPYGLDGVASDDEIASPVDLLYVGTPGLRKRTHLLPRVLSLVRESLPDACLRVVGFHLDDEFLLRSEAEHLGVMDGIQFVGPVTSEQVVPHYRSAKVLVVPSAYEGLPMVLLEGMREGLPAVATAVSGHPDAINDGESGFLVPLDDIEAMATRAVQLINDPELAARMGKRATQVVHERFSNERQIDAHLREQMNLVGRS